MVLAVSNLLWGFPGQLPLQGNRDISKTQHTAGGPSMVPQLQNHPGTAEPDSAVDQDFTGTQTVWPLRAPLASQPPSPGPGEKTLFSQRELLCYPVVFLQVGGKVLIASQVYRLAVGQVEQ